MQPSPRPTLSICSFTQPLMVGFLTAFAVASLTGSDALGWAAAIAAGGAFALYQRARGGAACAVPGATTDAPAARPAVTPEQLRAAGERAAATRATGTPGPPSNPTAAGHDAASPATTESATATSTHADASAGRGR